MMEPSKIMSSRRNIPTTTFLVALCLLWSCHLPLVRGISRCNQYRSASASIPHYYGSRRRQPHSSPMAMLVSSSRRRGSTNINHHYGKNGRDHSSSYSGDPFLEQTELIARSSKKKESKSQGKESKKSSDKSSGSSADPFETPMTTEEIYSHMGPVGKCIAGTVEIAVSTCMEYLTGFMGGYILGSITDVPRFVFKQVDPNQKNNPFFQELSQRYGRMHAKSFRWAKSWGSISAAFGGFRVATRVIRGGKEDEWNTVFSSAAAGAFFSRNGRTLESIFDMEGE